MRVELGGTYFWCIDHSWIEYGRHYANFLVLKGGKIPVSPKREIGGWIIESSSLNLCYRSHSVISSSSSCLPKAFSAVKNCFKYLRNRRSKPHPSPPTIVYPSSSPPPQEAPRNGDTSASSSGSPSWGKKYAKRPPSLIINSPQQQQHEQQSSEKYKAKTTTAGADETRGTLRKRLGSLVQGEGAANGQAESQVRRGSLQPEYVRGVSIGTEGGGSQSFTPRNFKVGDLSLAYDRSRMKKPTLAATPSPVEEAPSLAQFEGEESYIPKIAAHTKSWPYFLARNYYRLNNMKLGMTFLINVILLTYQVSNISFTFSYPWLANSEFLVCFRIKLAHEGVLVSRK